MGIGGRIRDWVNDQAEEWGERLGIFGGRMIGRGGKEAYNEISPELQKALLRALNEILDMTHSGTLRESLIEDGTLPDRELTGEELGVTIGAYSLSLLASIVGSPLGLLPFMNWIANGGLAEIFSQEGAKAFRPSKMSPSEAASALFRGLADPDKVGDHLAALGYPDSMMSALLDIHRPLLSPELVRMLSLRYPDDAEKFRAELAGAGYTEEQIEALEKLHQAVPPLPDMVRFADFGSFDPEIIELWHQFYDAPDWIVEPFKLLGISNEGTLDWANKYWFSHWVQPGRFELNLMHRRGLLGGRPFGETRPETTEEQEAADNIVKNAYRTQGYSSFWQERLLDLVATNLTRVDIRRMHALGVLNEQELSDAYHRAGYYGKNNEFMVQFTKRYNAQGERDLTKTEVVKGYRNRTITREEALTYLIELGYSEDDADYILETEDYTAGETDRQLSESKVKTLYLSGLMPKLEATDELVTMGYDAREIEYLYSLWDLERASRVKVPTRTELYSFWEDGIIDEAVFIDWMSRQGYQDIHIGWYVERYRREHAAEG